MDCAARRAGWIPAASPVMVPSMGVAMSVQLGTVGVHCLVMARVTVAVIPMSVPMVGQFQ
jgi:hypothetical protein